MLSIICASFTISCKDDFTSDSSCKLTLSVDTLKFDTVFTQTLSPTAVLKVYNKNKEDINISSIVLNSDYNFFKINVNGKVGTHFTDMEILSGDSIFIFVEIAPTENGDTLPLIIEDEIKFMYNGNVQKIVLSAYGQDAHHVKEVTHISGNVTWTNDKPYLVYDSIIVDSSAIWTIQEGVSLYMKKNATILLKGKIIINGTSEKEVIFRTDRKDYMTSKIAYDQLKDQWGGIRMSATSTGNFINHALIKNGAFGIEIDSAGISENEYRLTIANSQIHNVQSACLKSFNANILAYNSLFTNGNNGCVILAGGDYQFDHCTISSHQKGLGYYNYALTLSDSGYYEHPVVIPLPFKARFRNCIIAGDSTIGAKPRPEILILQSSLTDTLNYQFDHCLIQTNLSDKEIEEDINHYISIIANKAPRYVLLDNKLSLYDFHLSDNSPCKERGDLGIILKNDLYKTDKDGIERNVEATPDLGAYQIVVKTEESADSLANNKQ